MATKDIETVHIFLASTMGTDQWELDLPVNVVVQSIIAKLVQSQSLPFRRQDDLGNPVPYRLMWRERDRNLRETETLGDAGVEDRHTLVMTHQARAGQMSRRPVIA